MKIVDQAANAVSFVEDKVRESHFDKIIWMLRTRRDQAARQVQEWEQLRGLASQIKEHTLSKLGDYLEEFEASATKRVYMCAGHVMPTSITRFCIAFWRITRKRTS